MGGGVAGSAECHGKSDKESVGQVPFKWGALGSPHSSFSAQLCQNLVESGQLPTALT